MKLAQALLTIMVITNLNIAKADTTQILTGEKANQVANLLEKNGYVQDGIMTPQGPAARVFGIYQGKPAYCDFLWTHREPLSCAVDSDLVISADKDTSNNGR